MSELHIVVDCKEQGIGFSLVGGADQVTDKRVVITNIVPGAPADEAGLQVNDVLKSVNGILLEGMTHDEIIQRIQDSLPNITFGVSRRMIVEESVVDESSVDLTNKVAELDVKDRKQAAQQAYQLGDIEMTKIAHDIAPESHAGDKGAYVKAAVFGGLDGIITTFAVVASVAGADLATEVVIVMGIANLLADGISMGFGEYLSGHAELQYVEKERGREEWEFDNYPEGEVKEMIDLYEEKGFSHDEAKTIMQIMSKHKEFFIDHMMVQELGLMPPDADESPLKQGLVMFIAFMIFGFVPLISYVALSPIDWENEDYDARFVIAIGLTAIALFMLGAFKSKFSSMTWYSSGFWVLLNGGAAAGAAYLVGFILAEIVDIEECT